jgi:pyrroloquinoline quinone biosynthesis protein D
MSGAEVAGGSVLRFAAHAKFRFDEVRQAWIVLAPERLLLPNEQAVAVLQLIDGERDTDAIIDALSAQFEAPRRLTMSPASSVRSDRNTGPRAWCARRAWR